MMKRIIPQINQEVIVNNIHYAKTIVSHIQYVDREDRYHIILSWTDKDGKNLGTSRIYDTDYGKTWFFKHEIN